jgi:drug/metabolite transporter (DMT)-like permease
LQRKKDASFSNDFSRDKYLVASLYVIIGSILFSTKAILVKKVYLYGVDSNSLLALRMIFSLPLFLTVAWYVSSAEKNKAINISLRDWISILFFGICGFYIASLTDFIGLQYITAGLERVILFSFPTIVVLFSLIAGKKINNIIYLAVVLTYIGVILAYWGGLQNSDNIDIKKGSLFVGAAAISYAIYVYGSGTLLPKLGTLRYTSWAMIAACISIIIHNGILYNWNLFIFSKEVYFYATGISIFATVIPVFLFSEGVRIIGPNKSAIISSIGPVSTITLAYLFLGERYGLRELLGMVIIIIGVMIITLRK